jgi:hypothetical protein
MKENMSHKDGHLICPNDCKSQHKISAGEMIPQFPSHKDQDFKDIHGNDSVNSLTIEFRKIVGCQKSAMDHVAGIFFLARGSGLHTTLLSRESCVDNVVLYCS